MDADVVLVPAGERGEMRADALRSTIESLGDDRRRVFAVVATAVGEVRDVQGGGSLEVSLPSDTAWTAGNKVLLVSAVDLP